eukprot:TRINITY_DN19322_c0_g1_i1.p1 TRINITY_DN19322_c0_g1~~TRINITY_DN19322_c0_g1_i1.p1  ORF type:complete len:204 (+),score=13.53 TRINITY_DN19322_c0_g1_i1:57-668(+)
MGGREPALHLTQTEYHCIANANPEAASKRAFNFNAGKPWTDPESHRAKELRKGAGIYPRVQEESEYKLTKVPTVDRRTLGFSTTAMASLAGFTPRQVVRSEVHDLRGSQTIWHQHDHENSSCDKKVLRSMPVAGLNSARLGWTREHATHRSTGATDRPPWMSENESLPGGWHFTPSDKHGDPTRFGRDSHFTRNFPTSVGMHR